MQSFARMGLKWSSASYAMNTTVLRNEWGWTGAIDTDAAPCFEEYVDGGYKNHAAEVLAAGTQEWCLDSVGGHGQWVLQKAKDTDDGNLLERLLRRPSVGSTPSAVPESPTEWTPTRSSSTSHPGGRPPSPA